MAENKKNEDKRITINDIAKEAKVGVGTVSRAINNSGYVSKETKKKIHNIIKKTGYSPNAAARSLSKNFSSIIGIVVPEIDNPFISKLVSKIAHELSGRYTILLCNTEFSKKKLKSFVTELVQWKACGLISISIDLTDVEVKETINNHLNVITLFSKSEDYDYICTTEWQGVSDSTEHVISRGHRKIAYVGHDENLSSGLERLQGYIDTQKKHGIPIRQEYMIPHSYHIAEPGYKETKMLLNLEEPPTAILYSNDYYAINGYLAIAENNMQVGKDIAITGFDNTPFSLLASPLMTTVKYDTKTMAELASNILINRIENKQDVGDRKGVLLPTSLVIRDSVMSI